MLGSEGNDGLKLQISRRSCQEVCTTRTADGAECSDIPGAFQPGGFYDSGRPGSDWQEDGLEAEEQRTSFWFGSSSDSEGELQVGLNG